MMVSKHVIFTFIFAIILYPFIGINSLIVFLSGFLFDVDHYFYYAIKKKDISLMNSYRYSLSGSKLNKKRNNEKEDCFHIFHTIEVWILLIILSLFVKEFIFVFIGLMFHMFLDWIKLKWEYKRLKGQRAWSIIGWISRH